ncbi:ABC transporter permease subunit [Candidatus Riesia pediculicola]|uniref:ABC transporter permease subunit n=1 Tax=Candidatus Riesia pediculicola TaxID=401619 RepID=UPI00178CDF88|nr:ABC transporter permease subunit [Candidatus Riesia pediculicola]QOJ86475.1 ABC transporter permease subunit [Candidatus Riesia pediculicola]
MVTRGYPVKTISLLPGIMICLLMSSSILSVFFVLFSYSENIKWQNLIIDQYLWKVIKFTFSQAFFSAFFSVLIAIFLSKIYFRNSFFCNIFLKLSSITFVLPTTIVTMGILTVYGRSGWISEMFNLVKVEYSFNMYGFQGIVLTNVFINLPFSTQLLLRSIRSISDDQWKIIDQIGMKHWEYFFNIEWYYLKRQIFPIFILVFVLSFSNFSIILITGGGPSSTTIELAIYQMINYESNYQQAAFLSIIQLTFCLCLVVFLESLNKFPIIENDHKESFKNRYCSEIYQDTISNRIIILLSMIFFITPLIAIILDGINIELIKVLKDFYFWKSFWNSVIIAIGSGFFCTLFALMFLWSSRELYFYQMFFSYKLFHLISLILIMLPNTGLVSALSILLNDFFEIRSSYLSIIVINTLIFIPYSIKILEIPMNDIFKYYNNLCLSLKIIGLNRFFIIEYKKLKYDMRKSFILSCFFALGDMNALSIFEEKKFLTLSYYLYDHLNHFYTKEASAVSLLMFLLYIILFLLLEIFSQKNYD